LIGDVVPSLSNLICFVGLRCSQCGESDLRSEASDCNRQVVVDCQESDAVCFTRQTLVGRGENNKMCVSWHAVKAEFPTSTMNSCGETSQGRVRYCTCSANQCNSVAISSQVLLTESFEIALESVAQFSKTEALPPVVKIQPPASLPPPGVPEMPLALRCAMCLESGMSDPTADCSTSAPVLCSAIEKFCLTRQTQHEDATFSMEKRCVSEAQAESFVESSEVRSGCATAKGGLVNYCLCQGDLCNHDALLAQAQISGYDKSVPRIYFVINSIPKLRKESTRIAFHNIDKKDEIFKHRQKQRAKYSKVIVNDKCDQKKIQIQRVLGSTQ
uniref:Protein quiver n=1 Tax=Angiostrongylus cantonensis TaxID=6313 RepID=A0A0K0DFK2_ANGCA